MRRRKSLGVALCAVLLTPVPRGAAEGGAGSRLQALRLDRIDREWVVTILGTQAPDFTSFTLSEPFRVVVDWAGSELGKIPREKVFQQGMVRRLSAHELGPGSDRVSRVVVELAAPAPYIVKTGARGVQLHFSGAASPPVPPQAPGAKDPKFTRTELAVPAPPRAIASEGPLTEPKASIPKQPPRMGSVGAVVEGATGRRSGSSAATLGPDESRSRKEDAGSLDDVPAKSVADSVTHGQKPVPVSMESWSSARYRRAASSMSRISPRRTPLPKPRPAPKPVFQASVRPVPGQDPTPSGPPRIPKQTAMSLSARSSVTGGPSAGRNKEANPRALRPLPVTPDVPAAAGSRRSPDSGAGPAVSSGPAVASASERAVVPTLGARVAPDAGRARSPAATASHKTAASARGTPEVPDAGRARSPAATASHKTAASARGTPEVPDAGRARSPAATASHKTVASARGTPEVPDADRARSPAVSASHKTVASARGTPRAPDVDSVRGSSGSRSTSASPRIAVVSSDDPASPHSPTGASKALAGRTSRRAALGARPARVHLGSFAGRPKAEPVLVASLRGGRKETSPAVRTLASFTPRPKASPSPPKPLKSFRPSVAQGSDDASGGGLPSDADDFDPGPRVMKYIGFRQSAGTSRVFVRLDGKAQFRQKKEGATFVLELVNTSVNVKNNERPLDTSYFTGPVSRVQAVPSGANTRVEIRLKEHTPWKAKRIGTTIAIDFQHPTP